MLNFKANLLSQSRPDRTSTTNSFVVGRSMIQPLILSLNAIQHVGVTNNLTTSSSYPGGKMALNQASYSSPCNRPSVAAMHCVSTRFNVVPRTGCVWHQSWNGTSGLLPLASKAAVEVSLDKFGTKKDPEAIRMPAKSISGPIFTAVLHNLNSLREQFHIESQNAVMTPGHVNDAESLPVEAKVSQETSRQCSTMDSALPGETNSDQESTGGHEAAGGCKWRVSHVMLLPGRYQPKRGRFSCSCFVVTHRRPYACLKRLFGQRVARSRHNSTGSESANFVHAFAFVPGNESESEDDESCSGDSQIQSSESESEDDCDDHDADYSNLEFFNSCGLLNLDQQLKATVNNNSGNSQATQTNNSRPTVLNNATDSRSSKKRRVSAENELEESCWLQKDTIERPEGVSYSLVLSNTLFRRPSHSLQSASVKHHSCVLQSVPDNQAVPIDKETSTKKVRFATGSSLVQVHHLCTWNYWASRARRNEYVSENAHFKLRVDRCKKLLDTVLSCDHRAAVYSQRFSAN